MRGTGQRNNIIPKKRKGETAQVLAGIFNCTPRYIRRVIADKEKAIFKGDNPDKIRKAYNYYESESEYQKNALILSVEQLIKIA